MNEIEKYRILSAGKAFGHRESLKIFHKMTMFVSLYLYNFKTEMIMITEWIERINNPDASVGVCCSHKVVAVGFNTLCYDASVGVLNPPHE